MPVNNSTSTPSVVVRQQGYEVQQGPRWLAELLVAPPEWMVWLIALGFVAVPVAAGYAAKRRGVDQDTAVEVVANGLIVASAIAATTTAKQFLQLPYAADVAIGGIGALIAWQLAPRFVRWNIQQIQEHQSQETG